MQLYQKGETLFWKGDPGTGFFIVQSGRVKVFKVAPGGKEQILHDRHDHATVIELDVSKGQLAALLGTIPETLSRALYKLSQEGVIAMEGGQIRLCDRDQLMKLGHK